MPQLKKNMLQLFCAFIVVLFFCWLEYDSRLRVQDDLFSKVYLLNERIYKLESHESVIINSYNITNDSFFNFKYSNRKMIYAPTAKR